MKILIIGCGLAGLSAAITAAKASNSVTVISPFPPERSQSVLAAGGINAALNTKGENDSFLQHCEDTMKAGCFIADEKAVLNLTKNAPEIISDLEHYGTVFSRDENGFPDMRYFGGQKKKRTVFSKAGIGKQLVSGLSGELRRYCCEGKINLITNCKFVKCIITNGVYRGVIAENTADGNLSYMPSDALIVACGGPGGLFGKTTGSSTSDGFAAASLFVSGVKMANLEMVQFHPTAIETAQKRMLISEAARGEGGRLFTIKDGKRWYFMEDWYGKNGNLMPRDIVSQCIYKVCVLMKSGINGQKFVGLDLTHLGEDVVHNRLKEITDTCMLYLGIDPAKDYIPVYPAVHYFMGGIYVDRCHRASIPGIYAAGECSCMYHGANRLGGNSTLSAIYGGKTAVINANADFENLEKNRISKSDSNAEKMAHEEIEALTKLTEASVSDKRSESPSWLIQDIQIAMNLYLGIIRTPESLNEGMRILSEMYLRKPVFRKCHVSDALGAINMQQLGKAFFESALARRESRGAHMRSDYPDTDDEHYKKTSVSSYKDGQIEVHFEEIGRLFCDSEA